MGKCNVTWKLIYSHVICHINYYENANDLKSTKIFLKNSNQWLDSNLIGKGEKKKKKDQRVKKEINTFYVFKFPS